MIYLSVVLLKDYNIRIAWDSLSSAIKDHLGLDNIIVEKTGTLTCKYIFQTDMEPDPVQSAVQEAFSGFIPDSNEDASRSFILYTKPLSDAERNKLLPGTMEAMQANGWYTAQAGQTPEPAKKEAPAPPPVEPRPAPVPKQEASADEKAEKELPTLMGVTDKLTELQQKLLKLVRGQRHAIDELSHGLFEGEMFSKFTPDRKRPTSTFLFMGPSGVGKSYLAREFAIKSGQPYLEVDMSEFSDNLANLKFNGDHGQAALVTSFVRKHPNAVLIFNEIEKAHINTIYLFLEILDSGSLMDHQVNREVSFRDTTIIMTTNVGRDLYENSDSRNLSNIPRNALINALKSEKKENGYEQGPIFPTSITTRMANGHIIMFNHLEPYALLEIVRDEIMLQLDLFKSATGITVEFDEINLPALIMYAGGSSADARSLRGLARNMLVKEIQDAVMRINASPDQDLSSLKKIYLTVDIPESESEIYKLFHQTEGMQAVVFSDDKDALSAISIPYLDFQVTSDPAVLQKKARGVTDFVLLDPFTEYVADDRLPSDVEDIHSTGMEMFDYLLEYFPEIPIYVLDTGKYGKIDFTTLLSRGARGVLSTSGNPEDISDSLHEFSLNSLIGNTVYQLGRSGKFLGYNCAQYVIDEGTMEICFSNLRLKTAINGEDYGSITKKGENSNITFQDIVGCQTAKDALMEFCHMLDDPRKGILAGKRMPKGVLLYGPPGTGKTMLAKAMANESNAMFLPASATSFFGSLVGQTEGNIRALFKKARRYAPSVIFIDEVDAIARRRTGSSATSHNEDALNTLLAEMDGFVVDEKRPVFILAATNYELDGDGARVLDPAFVRRFDRKIHIDLPDTEARKELFRRLLEKHNIHFGDSHESALKNVAERSGGMCNADIEMVVEMYSRTLGDEAPSSSGFMDALDEYRFGDVKKYSEDNLRQTAYHEAGHALVSWVCGVKPLFMTIIARNNYGGYLETANEEKGTYTFSELKDIICRCLAGRAAELEVYGSVSGINTGASSDIKKARYLVRACLTEYGMGDTLFRHYTSEQGEALMQEQFQRAKDIVARNREALDKLVEILMKEKCLDREAIDVFFTENVQPGEEEA